MIPSSVLTGALLAATAGLAVTGPTAKSIRGIDIPGAIEITPASVYAESPGGMASIPEGAILVFGDDGLLHAVVTDDETREIQRKGEAMHPLD